MNMIPVGTSASVKVIIDPSAARRELDGMKREMVKLEETRKKFHTEMEHTVEGSGRLVSGQPNPNNSSALSGGGSKPIASSGLGGMAQTAAGLGLFGKVGLVAGAGALIYKTANDGIKQVPKILTVIRELLHDTFVGEYSDVLLQKDGQIVEAAENAKELAVERSAVVGGAIDTVTDVIDFNMAAATLGGTLPKGEHQLTLINGFFEINKANRQMQESLQLHREEVTLEVGMGEARSAMARLVKLAGSSFGR